MCDMFWLRPQPLFTKKPRSLMGDCPIPGCCVIRCGKIGTGRYPSYGFLTSPKRAKVALFTRWDSLFLVSSQGVSCLLFYDFLITSHGSLWRLTATRLPAEFYIREWEEWIIKGSHLEIMKRSKMPMLIAQAAVGITGRCFRYFFKHYCGMWDTTHRSQLHEERTPGSSGSCK